MQKGDTIRVLSTLDATSGYDATVLDVAADLILVRFVGFQGVVAFDAKTGVSLGGSHYIEL